MTPLADKIAQLRHRIDEAARSAGRTGAEVEIVAVTKRQPAEVVRAALGAGLTRFGENYVAEAAEKFESQQAMIDGFKAPSLHLIGHLQTNKARAAVGLFDMIESVDSARLAGAIDRAAAETGRTQPILIQVKLGHEDSKSGCSFDDLALLVETVQKRSNLRLAGLMGIAPMDEPARPWFAKLRVAFDALPVEHQQHLSMGMSADFEDAVREGSTLVRIGSVLFGERRYS